MRLGDGLVDGERALGVLSGADKTLVHRDAPVVDVQRVRVGQSRIRERITRIGGDGLLEEIDRFGDACARPLVPRVPAAQVERVRRDAFGVTLLPRRRNIAK